MADRGDIVIVIDLLDPQGRNPKNRPCVIVSSPERFAAGGPFDVVAITTLLPSLSITSLCPGIPGTIREPG